MKLLIRGLLTLGLCAMGITAIAQTQEETPEILVCEAEALRKANAYAAAYTTYERAYPFYAVDSNFYMMAFLKTWSSEMAFEESAYSDGAGAVKEAYRIAMDHLLVDTLSFYPITLMNMGILRGLQGNYEEKLEFYHEAKDAAHRTQGLYGDYTSMAYTNLGYVYGARNNFKQSLAYSDTALMIAERLGNTSGVFGAQNNRAHIYAEMGDLERAIFTQERALDAAVEKRDKARAANNLGVFYVEVKDWEKGIKYLKQALKLRREQGGGLTENVFSTQLNLVWAYSGSNQTAKSDALLEALVQEATAASPEFDESSLLQITYNYLARNAILSERLEEAWQYVQLAEAVDSWRISAAASTKLVKGMTLGAQENYVAALWAIQEAYQVLVPDYEPVNYSDLPDWRGIGTIAYTLTLFKLQAELQESLAEQEGNPELFQGALRTLEAADSAVTFSRLSYQSQMSKDLMASNAKELYNALIDLHYRLYATSKEAVHLERAFLYMEKNKALSLLENLNSMEAARFHDIPEAVVEAERSIRENIAFYQLELKADWLSEAPELEKQWSNELARLTKAQDSLIEIIKLEYPRYYNTRIEMSMPNLAVVRNQVLDSDETMIEYYQSDQYLYVLVVDAGQVHFKQLVISDLNENVERLYDALRNKNPEVGKISYQLYQQVFEPLLPFIRNEKLVIIPDGSLSYIPFDQFLMENPESGERRYLVEDFRIRRLLSGSTALEFKGIQKEVGVQYGITALAPLFTSGEGSVRAGDQFGPLPGAQKEVKTLNQLFKGTYLKGIAATEEAFKLRCAMAGILHLATHTVINDQFLNASHLLLKETEHEDGQLNVYEIYGQSIPAQLGFLSGCNTGFGKIKAGEGAVSLGHAFAYAGCPNIVMTLWPIKDDLAPELVKVFYEGISNGLDKAEALRQAKLYSLQNDELFAHPYYWSGFVYSGDRSVVELSASVISNYLLPTFAGLALLLLAFWILRRRSKARNP